MIIPPACTLMNCSLGLRNSDAQIFSFRRMDDIRFSSPLCSFVSFEVKGFAFPITAMAAITAIPAIGALRATALCLRPSASDPTPLDVLLITKAQPQFDRAVDRTVEAFFRVFQWSNLAQFQPDFSVFTVGRQRVATLNAKYLQQTLC